jgi:hypothetical protein
MCEGVCHQIITNYDTSFVNNAEELCVGDERTRSRVTRMLRAACVCLDPSVRYEKNDISRQNINLVVKQQPLYILKPFFPRFDEIPDDGWPKTSNRLPHPNLKMEMRTIFVQLRAPIFASPSALIALSLCQVSPTYRHYS